MLLNTRESKRMKLKYSTIIVFFVSIIVLLDGQFFACLPAVQSFLSSSGLNGYYNRTLIAFISVLLMLWIVCNRVNKKMQLTKYALTFWSKIAFFWICCVLVVTLYSLLANEEEIRYLFGEMRHYFLLFFIFPIMYLLFYYGSIDRFMKLITVCCVANVAVITVSVLSYSIVGRYLFQIETTGIRSGALYSRSMLGSLFPLVIIYSLAKIFDERNNKHIVPTILYLLIFIYIDQTRARMVYYAMTFIIMIFAKKGLNIRKGLNILFLVVLSIFVIYSGILNSFFNSFSVHSENKYSTLNRLEEIDYYFSVFKNNPLFGYGFISERNYNYLHLKKGPFLRCHPSDVGILGLLAEGGLILSIPYYVYLTRMIYVYRKISRDTKFQVFLIGLITYCVISSITQSLNRQILFLLIPVSAAITEFEYYNFKHKEFVNSIQEGDSSGEE